MAFEPAQATPPTGLFSQAGPDAAALPPKVAERLLALQERASDLHLLLPTSQERQELGTARQQAQQRLDRLLAHQADGGFHLHPDDPRVVAQRREVAELTAAKDRIEARHERASQAWEPARRLVTNVENWLRDRPGGTALQDFEGSAPKLNGKESLLEAIDKARRRVRELNADLHRIESAPYPSAHAKQRMRAEIEALRQRGAPSMSLLVEHDREIQWPQTNQRAAVFNSPVPAFASSETFDALAFACWLHGTDTLTKRLEAEIDAEADDGNALSHEDRERKAAEVQSDLLAVERDEASLVWAAMAQDLPATHRVDANPQAILQCQLVTIPAGNSAAPVERTGWDVTTGGKRRR